MNTLASISSMIANSPHEISIPNPFSNLTVNALTPSALVINTTINDTQTPTNTYTFTGQSGDTGSIEMVGSKYAMNLSGGTLKSTALAWVGNAVGMTYMAWIRLTTLQAYHSIVGFGVDITNSSTGMLFMVHNGGLACNANINTTTNETGMAALSTGVWYHVCCSVIHNGTKRFFVNGVNVGGNISTYTINTTTHKGRNLFVGWYSPSQYSMTKVDDMYKNRVKVFSVPLSDSQVAAIYADELDLI